MRQGLLVVRFERLRHRRGARSCERRRTVGERCHASSSPTAATALRIQKPARGHPCLPSPTVGSYSVLKVGRVTLAWKYRIPTITTFLFEQGDYYQRPRGDADDPDSDYMGTVGYRSTAGTVRDRLDDLGFTLAFWGGICDELLDEINELQVEQVAMALAERENGKGFPGDEFDARAKTHLARPPDRSATGDVAALVDLLRERIRQADGPPGATAALGRFSEKGGDLLIDPTEFAFEISRIPLEVDPGVLRITPLLEHEIDDYPEVAELFLVRCLVEAVEPDAEVHLDLSDIEDEGDDFSNQPAELAEELLRKLQVYSRVFSVLSENEPDVRRRAARGRARQLVQQLDAASHPDAKGRVLEELMAVIFESHPDLKVTERRLNLGDQEIDLVVDNHVDHAFWEKLASPFFFVECKNWAATVGTDEIRDFENPPTQPSQTDITVSPSSACSARSCSPLPSPSPSLPPPPPPLPKPASR